MRLKSIRPGEKGEGGYRRDQDRAAITREHPVDALGHHVAGSAAESTVVRGPCANPQSRFDPSELIEDFEHPICQICIGTGMVRDENRINMVRCDYCVFYIVADNAAALKGSQGSSRGPRLG
jgi:hypothetical protein